jgi:hypothetical protein
LVVFLAPAIVRCCSEMLLAVAFPACVRAVAQQPLYVITASAARGIGSGCG